MNRQSQTPPAAFRLTEAYICIMLAVYPLFTGFSGYARLTLHKYIFFSGITLLWLLGLLAAKLFFPRSPGLKRPGPIEVFLLLYLALCLISGLFSPFGLSVILGEGRFNGLLTILLCLFIFFGVSRFARFRTAYVYAAAAGALGSCLTALLQLLGKNPLGLFPSGYFYYDAGVKFSAVFLGTIGNAGLFSAHLCLVLPLLAVVYLKAEKRPFLLFLALFPISLCLFACKVSAGIFALGATTLLAAPFVIGSGKELRRALELLALLTLAAFLVFSLEPELTGQTLQLLFSPEKPSFALGALLLFLLLLRLALQKRDFSPRGLRRFFLALSAAIVLGGLMLVYFFGNRADGSIFELHSLLHGRLDDSFGSSRILIWQQTLALFPQRPLLGGGAGTLPLRLNLEFSRYVEETGKTLSTFVDNAHNDYLGILTDSGLPALLCYLSAQAVSLVQAARSKSPFAPALAFSLLCYWISSFFSLGLFLVSPLMWLLWGLLAAELRQSRA